MFIPGPKLNTLFASRWKALLWAGGVLLTAYCTVPSADETNAEDKVADQAAPHADSKPATSPWAPDPTPAHPGQ